MAPTIWVASTVQAQADQIWMTWRTSCGTTSQLTIEQSCIDDRKFYAALLTYHHIPFSSLAQMQRHHAKALPGLSRNWSHTLVAFTFTMCVNCLLALERDNVEGSASPHRQQQQSWMQQRSRRHCCRPCRHGGCHHDHGSCCCAPCSSPAAGAHDGCLHRQA